MILDDTKWFAAQKRTQQEYECVADEMRKITCAKLVKSDFELAIEHEIFDFIERSGGLYVGPGTTRRFKTDEDLYIAFWNERLN